jgi:hypothetical protein
MNAEIVNRLEASFSSPDEPLLVINKNTSEADIIWELRDSMQSLQAEVAELRASLVKAIAEAGVPDSTDVKGMVTEIWLTVAELLESVKALTKSPGPGAQAGALPEDAIKAILDTREMVSELHQAVKSPPPAPNPFAKKKKA